MIERPAATLTRPNLARPERTRSLFASPEVRAEQLRKHAEKAEADRQEADRRKAEETVKKKERARQRKLMATPEGKAKLNAEREARLQAKLDQKAQAKAAREADRAAKKAASKKQPRSIDPITEPEQTLHGEVWRSITTPDGLEIIVSNIGRIMRAVPASVGYPSKPTYGRPGLYGRQEWRVKIDGHRRTYWIDPLIAQAFPDTGPKVL